MEVITSKLSPVLPSAIIADNTSSRNKVEKPLPVSCMLISLPYSESLLSSIVAAQQQPQPPKQNNHNCSWVETK